MKKLNVGVIGLGWMGKNHARIYFDLSSVNLKSVCDVDSEVAQTISEKYNVKAYSDYKDMIANEDLDIVSITVPTSLHKEVAVECINNGIHVLVEKPITLTVEDARYMINLAKEKNVKLMVGYTERFNPAIIEAKRRIKKKELGRIFKVSVNRQSPYPKRINDVGVVIDLATHDIDVIHMLLEKKFVNLFCKTKGHINSHFEDFMHCVAELESGIVASISADWVTPAKIREISITGEKGMFLVNYLTQELYFFENKYLAPDKEYAEMIMGVSEGNMTKIQIDKKEPLRNEITAFVEYVQNGSIAPVSAEDATYALMICNEMIKSAKSQKFIKLLYGEK